MKSGAQRAGVVLAVWILSLLTPARGIAEPDDPTVGQAESSPTVAAEAQPSTQVVDVGEQSGGPIAEACKQFLAALNVAAVNYDEFAYATAGGGDYVDYQDPNVAQTNVVGRTALREAAAAAMSASRTPGLPAEVAGPMREWSMRATKLLVVMGLRAGGDMLNRSAESLNADAAEAQLACAVARLQG